MSDMDDAESSSANSQYTERSDDGSEEFKYSRTAAVQAVRDYYAFLCTMYLDPARVSEPPTGGWPQITMERFHHMHKSEEVIDLLRHLPYITTTEEDDDVAYGSAHCVFADWAAEAGPKKFPDSPEWTDEQEGEAWRVGSEVWEYEDVPPYVVGLTLGGAKNETMLLDTEIGVIHWIECPTELKQWLRVYPDGRIEPYRNSDGEEPSEEEDCTIIKGVSHDYFANDWEVEEEREWRSRGGTWEIADFFEILKAQFRSLTFVPASDCKVYSARTNWVGHNDMRAEVQGIWREFGWPGAAEEGPEGEATFDKQACLAKIKDVVQGKYHLDTSLI